MHLHEKLKYVILTILNNTQKFVHQFNLLCACQQIWLACLCERKMGEERRWQAEKVSRCNSEHQEGYSEI